MDIYRGIKMKINLEKLFDNCAICNSRHFKFIMLKKKNNIYICRDCANKSEHYGNSIWIYSPEEIKRGIELKRNIAEMKEEEEREAKHREFLRSQHKKYMEMVQSIKFIKPTISCEKVHRKFLKDIPEINLTFNRYHFQLFANYYDIKNNPKFCYINTIGEAPKYSYSIQTIDFIVEEIKKDPDNIINNLKNKLNKKS